MNKTVEEVAGSLAYSIVQGETGFYKPCYESVLKELQTLLTSQRQTLREEIGKMKKEFDETPYSYSETLQANREYGYNTAIADVLALLDNKEV